MIGPSQGKCGEVWCGVISAKANLVLVAYSNAEIRRKSWPGQVGLSWLNCCDRSNISSTLRIRRSECSTRTMVHRNHIGQLTSLATFAWRSYATQTMGRPVTKVPIPGVDHIIAVASGKGGVGKSTTAGQCCHNAPKRTWYKARALQLTHLQSI